MIRPFDQKGLVCALMISYEFIIIISNNNAITQFYSEAIGHLCQILITKLLQKDQNALTVVARMAEEFRD